MRVIEITLILKLCITYFALLSKSVEYAILAVPFWFSISFFKRHAFFIFFSSLLNNIGIVVFILIHMYYLTNCVLFDTAVIYFPTYVYLDIYHKKDVIFTVHLLTYYKKYYRISCGSISSKSTPYDRKAIVFDSIDIYAGVCKKLLRLCCIALKLPEVGVFLISIVL